MRIIRYLKNCKVAVLLIVCLLVVQAFTDLALPHYTSDIVDVGIQQSGVEHAATDEMTAKTHDEIAMMLPVDDEQTFRDAYTETDDGTYKLNDQGKKEQEELDRMVALPLVAIHYVSNRKLTQDCNVMNHIHHTLHKIRLYIPTYLHSAHRVFYFPNILS